MENKILDELQISNLKVAGNHFVTLGSLTIRKLIIDGDCYFNLSLSECEIDKFDIDHKEGVISVRFNQCDIDDFAFISGGKVEDLLFWDCGTIGSLFFGDVRISSVRIYSVKELNSIQVPFGAKIETLEIINSDIKNAEGERIFFLRLLRHQK